eukprot:921358-Prymnesium_polylepis.1
MECGRAGDARHVVAARTTPSLDARLLLPPVAQAAHVAVDAYQTTQRRLGDPTIDKSTETSATTMVDYSVRPWTRRHEVRSF